MLMFVNGRLAKVDYLADSRFTPGLFGEALARAKREGIRILTTEAGKKFATSGSDVDKLYDVSIENGCSCPAFSNYGQCKHFALFLSSLGVSGQFFLGQPI